MQSTNEYDGNTFDLHYYFDASVEKSEREVYNDDGVTRNAYNQGLFERLAFESETKKGSFEIEFEAELGDHYSASTKVINVIVHNFPRQPKRIKSHGKTLEFSYDTLSKVLFFAIEWNTLKAIETKIRF
ncbi:DUF5110 domain-containing protein [Lacinutrix neustonica]|uniref:DUF5110 domain-containing protein n=2 Tax=Lacinutrix neustonica TaxID=2980107 RepID=A0A9E8MY83_9FLAO|nr:DUF5110 domain-containing protein [Lacinutrix neustonica]WAC03898.1 DUF5110 domain-containing protein [Lacinutrix neustonica]